jgi:hypothetical protein
VSAFRSTRWATVVTNCARNPRLPTVTARLTANEKERFVALASSYGISETALALIAIRGLLNSNHEVPSTGSSTREPATDRITIRLRPGDGRAIADRAAERGIKPSKYLAALIRAHVATNPPMTTDELLALKKAVALLARVGTLLAATSRQIAQTVPQPEGLLRELRQTRAVVAEVERRAHDLARAALISWETRYD